jgi:hypothetical protein
MQCTNDVIKNIDKSFAGVEYKPIKKDGVLTSEIYQWKSKDIGVSGINLISFDNKNQNLTLQLSAKVLSENYYDLINVNTIEQVFDNINKTGIVEINKQNASNFKILSCDFTNNIKGDHTPHEYIEACQLMSLNSRYKVDVYNGKGDHNNKNGIVFNGRQKTFKERCIMYGKKDEIIKDRNFIKSLNKPMLMINQFDGVLRSEMNISSFAKIREYSNTANTLMSVLNSNAVNPNYKLFQKIKSKSGVQTDLFSMSQNMKLYEIEKLYGRQTIIKELCFDMDLIHDFIKRHVKGDTHKYIKDYRFIANEMLVTDNINGQNENNIIFELEQLLKVA